MTYYPDHGDHFTAGQMADLLGTLPRDTPLFITGYEGNLNYAVELVPRTVALFARTEEFYGQHASTTTDADGQPLDTFGYEITGKHVARPKDPS